MISAASPVPWRSALMAVTTSVGGNDAGSTTREWYRMAVNGLGMPSNNSSSLCTIGQVLPCIARCAHDLPTEGFADRLVAQTDAQDGYVAGQRADQRNQNPRLGRRPGTRRKHDRRGLQRLHVSDAERVVPVDNRVLAQLAEVLHQGGGERVVVVEHEQHAEF